MMRHIMACVESFTGDYPAGLYDYEKNYKSI